MAKILKYVLNVALVSIIIVLTVYIIMNLVGKMWIYRVQTGSMEAGIHVGDYILVFKCNDYEVGDIVTYKINNAFVTHRIVQKNNESIVTKGDANNVEDDEIGTDRIIGKVIYSGKLLNFLIDYKFAIIAILLALYLLSMYFGDEKGEKNEIKDAQF